MEEVNDPAADRASSSPERAGQAEQRLASIPLVGPVASSVAGSIWSVAGQEAFIADTPERLADWPGPLTPTMTASCASMSSPTSGPVSMRIAGEWQVGDDGSATRPVDQGPSTVCRRDAASRQVLGRFWRHRTVFSAGLMRDLGFPAATSSQSSILQGISGVCESVVVRTVVILDLR